MTKLNRHTAETHHSGYTVRYDDNRNLEASYGCFMQKDISNSILDFKEAIRHLWNTYFAKSNSPMSPETQQLFEDIEAKLFEALVLLPLNMQGETELYRKHSIPFILVKPANSVCDLPLLVGERDNVGNMIWRPASVSVDDKVILEFCDFFDWYFYGFINLPYVRAKVTSLPSEPSLQGAIVLIEQIHCHFIFMKSKG